MIQESFDGLWMNLGVDRFMQMTPARYQPGIGLRPTSKAKSERPALEPLISRLYRAMYASIAAHSRLGINVVVDVGHHDAYTIPLNILPQCAQCLIGLPILFVGIRCPIEVIIERRRATGWAVSGTDDDPIPPPVRLWQRAVHTPGIYDLEVDTSRLNPAECAAAIQHHLETGGEQSAFHEQRDAAD